MKPPLKLSGLEEAFEILCLILLSTFNDCSLKGLSIISGFVILILSFLFGWGGFSRDGLFGGYFAKLVLWLGEGGLGKILLEDLYIGLGFGISAWTEPTFDDYYFSNPILDSLKF